MRRFVIISAVVFLTFSLGLASMELYLSYGPRFRVRELRTGDCSASLVYGTSDGKEIRVSHEACVPSRAQDLLRFYRAEAKLIEQGPRLDWRGREIGGRAAVVWPRWEGDGQGEGVRVILTQGEDYWLIDAPSPELAREFEGSFEFRHAMSNYRMHPTAPHAASHVR